MLAVLSIRESQGDREAVHPLLEPCPFDHLRVETSPPFKFINGEIGNLMLCGNTTVANSQKKPFDFLHWVVVGPDQKSFPGPLVTSVSVNYMQPRQILGQRV